MLKITNLFIFQVVRTTFKHEIYTLSQQTPLVLQHNIHHYDQFLCIHDKSPLQKISACIHNLLLIFVANTPGLEKNG